MRSVMIVDDDTDICMTMQITLEAYGYRTTTASDGAEALHMLETDEAPCLILLDLMMPGMNGQEFREAQLRQPRVRRDPGRGHVGRLQGQRASGGDGGRGARQADRAASAARQGR